MANSGRAREQDQRTELGSPGSLRACDSGAMRRLDTRAKRLSAGLAVALVIAGVLIAVLGGSGRGPGGRRLPGQRSPGAQAAERAEHGEIAVAAAYLGLTHAQLRARLRSGSSLAEIAAGTHGTSVAGLTERLVAARPATHKAAQLPPQQAKTLRARVQRSVAAAIGRHRLGGPRAGTNARVAARYLGLSPSKLRAEVRRGKTLAQIARATHGHSPAGLIAALVAARQRALDRARGSGVISGAAEKRLLATVRARVTATVNQPLGH
jgi:hypothetical protein